MRWPSGLRQGMTEGLDAEEEGYWFYPPLTVFLKTINSKIGKSMSTLAINGYLMSAWLLEAFPPCETQMRNSFAQKSSWKTTFLHIGELRQTSTLGVPK
ncbi:hypothetical protein AVEN_129606-1 [Araneus ventricosus]|uniref:Uncharacterized protein n=1 Tax=Araneus ventricosus TaxID=182803 RepID=A0A4Y2MSP4_ARAVE|nr:hypothetical protein AVEN_129606-1 [Araneus ventricosus]